MFTDFLSLLWSLEVVVVLQGREPSSFLQIFQGCLIVHKGRREEVHTAGTGVGTLPASSGFCAGI